MIEGFPKWHQVLGAGLFVVLVYIAYNSLSRRYSLPTAF